MRVVVERHNVGEKRPASRILFDAPNRADGARGPNRAQPDVGVRANALRVVSLRGSGPGRIRINGELLEPGDVGRRLDLLEQTSTLPRALHESSRGDEHAGADRESRSRHCHEHIRHRDSRGDQMTRLPDDPMARWPDGPMTGSNCDDPMTEVTGVECPR